MRSPWVERSFLLGSLLLWLTWATSVPAAMPDDRASQAFRIADGDVPLNLVETPDRTLVSLNSGFGSIICWPTMRRESRCAAAWN